MNEVSGFLNKQISAIEKAYANFIDDLTVQAQRIADKGDKIADRNFGIYQALKIREIFRQAVQDFYDDYTPQFYNRTGGLFDILDVHFNADGFVGYENIEDLYNKGKLHTDRNGGDLFKKVFEYGYHGGAASGDFHPNPGIPYYRKPPEGNSAGIRPWVRWGRAAERTSPSPDEVFKRDLAMAEGGEIFEKFKEICDEHAARSALKINKEIVPALANKHFKYIL